MAFCGRSSFCLGGMMVGVVALVGSGSGQGEGTILQQEDATLQQATALRPPAPARTFCPGLDICSASDTAALLNSTSYFLTSAKRSRRKNVAQPSIA